MAPMPVSMMAAQTDMESIQTRRLRIAKPPSQDYLRQWCRALQRLPPRASQALKRFERGWIVEHLSHQARTESCNSVLSTPPMKAPVTCHTPRTSTPHIPSPWKNHRRLIWTRQTLPRMIAYERRIVVAAIPLPTVEFFRTTTSIPEDILRNTRLFGAGEWICHRDVGGYHNFGTDSDRLHCGLSPAQELSCLYFTIPAWDPCSFIRRPETRDQRPYCRYAAAWSADKTGSKTFVRCIKSA